MALRAPVSSFDQPSAQKTLSLRNYSWLSEMKRELGIRAAVSMERAWERRWSRTWSEGIPFAIRLFASIVAAFR
jgi:hypothetical protein